MTTEMFTHKAEPAVLNKFVYNLWNNECRTRAVAQWLELRATHNNGGRHYTWRVRKLRPALDWLLVRGKGSYEDGDWKSLVVGIRAASRQAFDEYRRMFFVALENLFAGQATRMSPSTLRFRTEYAGIRRGGWPWMAAEINLRQTGKAIHSRIARYLPKMSLVCVCGVDRNDWFTQTARGYGFGDYRHVLTDKDVPHDTAYVFPEAAVRVPCLQHQTWMVEYDAGAVSVCSYLTFVFEKPSLFVRVIGQVKE